MRNFILFSFYTGISMTLNLMKKLKMEFWERERIHEITSEIRFADWGLVKVDSIRIGESFSADWRHLSNCCGRIWCSNDWNGCMCATLVHYEYTSLWLTTKDPLEKKDFFKNSLMKSKISSPELLIIACYSFKITSFSLWLTWMCLGVADVMLWICAGELTRVYFCQN